MKRGRKPKCPYCGASDNIAKGVRKTVTMGDRSLRVCNQCHRKFTVKRTTAMARLAVVKAASPVTGNPDAPVSPDAPSDL